jgi:MSHA biogenesis protein MshP
LNPSLIKYQAGGALIVAIFIILIMSLLGTGLAVLQRDSAKGVIYEVYGARAHLSAYSANEIAMLSLFPTDTTKAAVCLGEDKKIVVELTADTVGFHDCDDVYYTCHITTSEAGKIYTIQSVAICQNKEISVRRKITTKVPWL